MKLLSRHLLILVLLSLTRTSPGQQTLFPSSTRHPGFTPFVEEITNFYTSKARNATNNADLAGLAWAIEVLEDLNIYKDPIVNANLENMKGILYYYKGDNNNALACYLDALESFDRAGIHGATNTIMNNIAIIFAQIEDFESTRKYLVKALEITQADDLISRSLYLYNLAETESKIGNCDSGLLIAGEVLDLFSIGQVPFSKVAVYSIMIACYNNMGDSDNGEKLIELGLGEMSNDITYLDKLSFYSAAIEHYFKKGDHQSVLKMGREIYPPPDTTFTRDMYQSIDYMAISARLTGDLMYAAELNRVANRIEFNRTSLSREDLITPLMEEYSFNRDNNERDLLRVELMENSIRERAQRKLLLYLLIASGILGVLVVILSRTRVIRGRYKKAIISENLKLEEINRELQSHNLELERENKLLDTLISVFAHDLINPFQAILGFSQLMISDHDVLKDEDYIEYSDLLSETSFHLNQLLINLKSMSIVQDKNRGLSQGKFKVKPLVENILKLFEPSSRKKDITFRLDSCLSPEIVMNQDIFESVFRNVISNAVKFSKHGGLIEIRCELSTSALEISVRDHGIGMPESTREALLSRKYLDSRPGTGNEKGSGIGLAICIELLEMFNSSIDIISAVDEGTTVVIEIPLPADETED